MNIQRVYTYAAVTDLYWEQCGEAGVLEFFKSSLAQCVAANGGYGSVLESWKPLSAKEAKAIGLKRHPQTTWYRLDGTGVQGLLVAGGVH